jgi:hypothetical protein
MQGLYWALVAAAVLHVAEETCFDWVGWAKRFVKGVTWRQFVFINALFLLLMAAGAFMATRTPAFALSTAALLFINAWFHIGPSVATRTYSPGLVSALLLYLPLPVLAYARSIRLQGTSLREMVLTFLWGAAWMLFPLLFQGGRLVWERLRPAPARQVAP